MTRSNEILFIDSGVSDIGTLLRTTRPEVEAFILDNHRPAARQIAEALTGRAGLDAIHIIAHGAPGRVAFASGDWSADTLDDDRDDLATIGHALTEQGGLRLWSCHAGAGLEGARFTVRMAAAAGTAVNAAESLVGASGLGGAWSLTGAPLAPITTEGVARYAGVLTAYTAYRTANWTGTGTSNGWAFNSSSFPSAAADTATINAAYTITVSATESISTLTVSTNASAELLMNGA